MNMSKLTTEVFIAKAKAVHGDRYDYSKVNYVNSKTKVCIICKEHGEFWQIANTHLLGSGCPICVGRKKMRTEDFIKRAQLIHGDKYDYSRVEYRGNTKKVCIICREHGFFFQNAGSHLKGIGCPKCGIIKSSSQQKIWTKEKCFETALQYKDVGTFVKESQSAYVIAHRNHWLKDYTWLDRKKMPNGYWTKELVMEEAHKYNSSGEFRKGNLCAYNAAIRNGWIKECLWFRMPLNAKKWDYNTCFDEAQKYTSRTEFRSNSINAYCVARNKGWLQEYDWLEKRFLWNYDTCKKEAEKYEYYHDFRSNSHKAYMVAQRKGWLKDYTWLIIEPLESPNKKWNYDTCYSEAKKYKRRSDFGKGSKGAYKVACRNGWISDYKWMPDLTDDNAKVDSVYCYIFEEQHAVYVGRTLMYRQHIRDIEHCNLDNDTVYKFAHSNNCKIPKMKIIEELLTIQQGREKEDYWRKQYESQGYTILNRGATGAKSGSIGALGSGKWTFEKAYKIARCFETVNDMCEEYEYLYKISKAKGWIDKFDWFRGKEIRLEKITKWTENVCREEALKYKSRKEFRKYCRGAYDKAKECGWLDTFTWLSRYKSRSEWNYDNCKEEAGKYPNRNEFGKHSYGAYTCSRLNGWLDEFYPIPLRRVLDYDTCKKLASEYNSINELLAKDVVLYNSLRKKGWISDFFPEKKT